MKKVTNELDISKVKKIYRDFATYIMKNSLCFIIDNNELKIKTLEYDHEDTSSLTANLNDERSIDFYKKNKFKIKEDDENYNYKDFLDKTVNDFRIEIYDVGVKILGLLKNENDEIVETKGLFFLLSEFASYNKTENAERPNWRTSSPNVPF